MQYIHVGDILALELSTKPDYNSSQISELKQKTWCYFRLVAKFSKSNWYNFACSTDSKIGRTTRIVRAWVLCIHFNKIKLRPETEVENNQLTIINMAPLFLLGRSIFCLQQIYQKWAGVHKPLRDRWSFRCISPSYI